MDPTETTAALRILLAVACADGRLAADEENLLDVVAERMNQAGAPHALDGAVDVAREARRIRSPEARRTTFDAAVALAAVDGECSPEEHALLLQLRDLLQVDAAIDLAAAERRSAERVARVRDDLDRATIDFLGRIRRAESGGDLPQEEYEELVHDLSRRKHELLAQALED